MKKYLVILLCFISSVFCFAEDLFNLSHVDIINKLGIPSKIIAESSRTNKYKGVEIISDNDISFFYDNLIVQLDSCIDLETEFRKEVKPETTMLHVCGLLFFKDSKYIPYNLSFNDTFISILEKLGNPDKYSKEIIEYTIPVENEDIKQRYIPYLRGKQEAIDHLLIHMIDSKIDSIQIIRTHTFNLDLR